MKKQKTKVHFMDMNLINATNPIKVNLIGAGGTGSRVLKALTDMNNCMVTLGHPGLEVHLWDDDIITDANLGRQDFALSELGLYKSVALINRANRWAGTNWKAETIKYDEQSENARAGIFISCVDNVATRFQIADALKNMDKRHYYRDRPRYWMDFGNSRYSGQVILSTIGDINQPCSDQYETFANLPFITEEFGELLVESENTDNTPSCSLGEALEQQDLYINSSLAQLGCSLLWKLFRSGMTEYRGLFLNLETYQSQNLKIA